jgi:hypothetical protein
VCCAFHVTFHWANNYAAASEETLGQLIQRLKKLGAMCIINTKTMNESLLVKWIWKIFQQPDELWYKIVEAKYLRGHGFFYSKINGGSQFWKGLHKVKHLFKWGAVFKVGDGKVRRFGRTVGYRMCL